MTRVYAQPGVDALLGTNIRHLREDAGLTVSQLSERLGWPAQRITDIEAGEARPRSIEMSRLRQEFACGFDALFVEPRAERLLS